MEYITCTFYIYGPGNTFVSANFTDVSLAETNPYDIADYNDSTENINNRTASSNLNDNSITYMDVSLNIFFFRLFDFLYSIFLLGLLK